jgi:hypothetical protein
LLKTAIGHLPRLRHREAACPFLRLEIPYRRARTIGVT